MKLIYIAGPYRAMPANEIYDNIHRADVLGRKVAWLSNAFPIIPHNNTPLHWKDIREGSYFVDGTNELCVRCDAVLVMPEFENSSGTKGEIEAMRKIGKPVFFTLEGLETWLEGEAGG